MADLRKDGCCNIRQPHPVGKFDGTNGSRPATRRASKLMVVASVETAIGPLQFTTIGQSARTLLALVAAGPKGVTALEASSWGFRLAAYTHSLIHEYGLHIVTAREGHPGGWHGRHILLDRVTIVNVSNPVGKERKAAA
jgi:hypothetical protein